MVDRASAPSSPPPVVKLRPKLEPTLKAQSLTWDDVLPALHELDTLEKLQGAATDPEGFLLKTMEQVAGPAAIKLALGKLRPTLEPHLVEKVRNRRRHFAAIRSAGFTGFTDSDPRSS